MQKVYDSRPCTLGEGVFWHPERGALFWFDIIAGRMLSRANGVPQTWDFDEMVSAAGWIDHDRLLLASETKLAVFHLETHALEPVLPLEADQPGTRSNDGRADPFGGFWISTMGKTAEPGAGAIYRFYRGTLRRMVDRLTIPNAICFAPDGGTAYFTDTPTRQVMAQPLDGEGWPKGAARVLIDLADTELNPDGAVTDADGNLWIAQWGAGRVVVHAPDGRFLRALSVGAKKTSCPAFGGPGLETVYVTTAQEGYGAAGLVEDPLAGQVFAAPAGAKGRPEPRVLLR